MTIDTYDLVPPDLRCPGNDMELAPVSCPGDWIKYIDHQAAIKAEVELIAKWLVECSKIKDLEYSTARTFVRCAGYVRDGEYKTGSTGDD